MRELGFVFGAEVAGNRLYERGPDSLTIRSPNLNGDLPEMIVNDAFDAAGLPMLAWPTHWCD